MYCIAESEKGHEIPVKTALTGHKNNTYSTGMLMTFTEIRNNVLQILADNIEDNCPPNVTNTSYIANQLDISIERLVETLKAMHVSGVIICNVENTYSIITRKGLKYLQRFK
jgi:predicted transcriptional regulator